MLDYFVNSAWLIRAWLIWLIIISKYGKCQCMLFEVAWKFIRRKITENYILIFSFVHNKISHRQLHLSNLTDVKSMKINSCESYYRQTNCKYFKCSIIIERSNFLYDPHFPSDSLLTEPNCDNCTRFRLR